MARLSNVIFNLASMYLRSHTHIHFLVGLLIVLLVSPIVAPAIAKSAGITASATVSSGQPGTIVTTIINNESSIYDSIVDIEVYNSANVRVGQKFFEHQDIVSGAQKVFSYSFVPPSTGTYTLKVGIFRAGWSSNIFWNSLVTTFSFSTPQLVQTPAVNVWWPSSGTIITGNQPFKMQLSGAQLSEYNAYWQVDAGAWNTMNDNMTDGPHKETVVNVTNWNWKGTGPYTLTFIAQKKLTGEIIKKNISVSIGSNSAPQSSLTITISSPVQTLPLPTTDQTSTGLFVNPNSPALVQAQQWQSSRPTDAALMKKIGGQPSARWFGNWNANIYTDIKSYVDAAATDNATPVLIAYNIPQRDCGGHSAGGSNDPAVYRQWITDMARGIGNRSAMIILEPDSVALNDCLSSTDKQTRFGLLSYAVDTLKANPNARVYIDGGHPGWVGAQDMANRLTQAGIARADGFALNVSNFYPTQDNVNYGTQVSQFLGGKHFVVDTSRNGRGSNGQWCNPSDRALGEKPTLITGNVLIDGFLWLKTPGESDGNCNGGPAAGQWWSEYALGLAQRASWST